MKKFIFAIIALFAINANAAPEPFNLNNVSKCYPMAQEIDRKDDLIAYDLMFEEYKIGLTGEERDEYMATRGYDAGYMAGMKKSPLATSNPLLFKAALEKVYLNECIKYIINGVSF